MAVIALISRARMQTHPELNRTTVIQPETRREAPVRVPFHKPLWAVLILILGIAGWSGTNAPPTPAFVYAANNGSNNVSAFSVTPSSGALTPVSGSPYAAGTAPTAIAADPAGKFIYVANVGSNNITAYAVSPSSGALTSIPG
jgi:DNA-binding beta-propeller fold protein YncE